MEKISVDVACVGYSRSESGKLWKVVTMLGAYQSQADLKWAQASRTFDNREDAEQYRQALQQQLDVEKNRKADIESGSDYYVYEALVGHAGGSFQISMC